MTGRAALLETLRRCADALGGELSADDRRRLIDLHEQAVRLLEQHGERRRAETLARLAELRRLERLMRHMEPGERAFAIRERMGISKSGYYKLRKLALSPRLSVDSDAV